MRLGHSIYCCIGLLALFLCGCNQYGTNSAENITSASNSEKSTLRLKIDGVQTAAIIDLGKVLPDSKSERAIPVRNPTDSEIVLDRFQSSCECTEVIGLPLIIPAGKTAELTLVNDQSKEPGFIGSLAIMIDLFEKEQIIGKLEVQVTVSKDAGNAQGNAGKPDANNQQLEKANPTSPDSPSNNLREPTLAPPRKGKSSNP